MLSLLSYRLRRLQRSVLAKMTLLAPRFGALKDAPVPLMRLEYSGGKRNRRLIIFLPGIDDLAEDFERRGFIHEMRRQGIAADAIAVDAHFGYYATRVIFDRITDDIIESAHASGYEEIWLVGISLGGFGAASYVARHVSPITGIVLFAPYLGDKKLIQEIADAGGLRQWEPGHVGHTDVQRSVWAWFKRHLSGTPERSPSPVIYIGYGARDMFARANELLAEILPPDRVFAIPGRHNWKTWESLWRMFLSQWSKRYD